MSRNCLTPHPLKIDFLFQTKLKLLFSRFFSPFLAIKIGWAGLGWAGLGWAGLGWAGLGFAGLGWAGLGSGKLC
jgi:hypothetical protein